MQKKREHPELWASEKYIRWPPYHVNPTIRLPLPSEGMRSITVKREEFELEQDLFNRCKVMRDSLGEKLWGEKTWRYMLAVKSRSVTRGKSGDSENGVRHVVRVGKANAWQAYWHERDANGKRTQRSKLFSYGTPRSPFSTSAQAKTRAMAVRKKKEKDWYIADSQLFNKRRLSYREMFQREICAAITGYTKALSEQEMRRKAEELPEFAAFLSAKKSSHRGMSVDDLLDIADGLGVKLEINVKKGLSTARGIE